MNTTKITQRKSTLFYTVTLLILLLNLAGCSLKREDVGPYQGDQQTYAFTDFDRIDMGSAFIITVQQGTTYGVTVEGDRRNLADLQVYTRNGTLMAQYRIARRREYKTSFTITMPILRGVDFSGASRSTITGFSNLSTLDITLSGASESQFTGQATRTNVKLSGASVLRLSGQGTALSADLSGESLLQAFGYPVDNVGLDASGASNANVNVASTLVVNASGASNIRYRGKPTVQQRVSGASTVQND
ncbi:head GIN domain-containing protein [Spirosoma jeollabukense]